jgi:ABC-type dipeptide/oligopeptide/nickel transport system permease component
MLAYLARRLALLVPLALGTIVLTFSLMLLVPGDPATVILGQEASPEAIAQLRRNLGLDEPALVRLGRYMAGLAQGDLGRSLTQSEAVSTLILSRLGATIELAVAALLLATLVGLALGVLAAMRRGSPIDLATMLVAQLGVSMPVFWLGILLMYAFAVQLNWLPSIGRGPPVTAALGEAFAGRFEPLRDALAHLALPAAALGANAAAIISRLVRASMLEVLGEDFIRTARSKGLFPRQVLVTHALRNALLPVISIIGLRFGALLGGAVLTEAIFGWPGLGQLTITAIQQRDLPLVQGIVLTFALMFALLNLVVDLAYAVADPRIRLG